MEIMAGLPEEQGSGLPDIGYPEIGIVWFFLVTPESNGNRPARDPFYRLDQFFVAGLDTGANIDDLVFQIGALGGHKKGINNILDIDEITSYAFLCQSEFLSPQGGSKCGRNESIRRFPRTVNMEQA